MATSNLEPRFEGWLAYDRQSADGKMVWGTFEPKKWEETDVDIRITHSSICGSDLHTLKSGWGPTDYPCCVGHEIIGTVIRVGREASTDIKIGDRVGVGAQCDSCLGRTTGKCDECASGTEQYCQHAFVGTYNARHLNGDKSYGGYALFNRSPSHFVFKIPDRLSSATAAPMLCAGITTYSPLKHYGCGPGKRVGVVGVGGLGHFAILWAKALGTDRVIAISRKDNKRIDALQLGADHYIATDHDSQWMAQHARTLDIIVSTVSSCKMTLGAYLSLLRKDGILIQVGNPDDGSLNVPASALIGSRVKIGGSLIGSPTEIREMLNFAAENNVQAMVEERPMEDANQAILDMEAGKARYRLVLVNRQNF